MVAKLSIWLCNCCPMLSNSCCSCWRIASSSATVCLLALISPTEFMARLTLLILVCDNALRPINAPKTAEPILTPASSQPLLDSAACCWYFSLAACSFLASASCFLAKLSRSWAMAISRCSCSGTMSRLRKASSLSATSLYSFKLSTYHRFNTCC